LIAVCNECHKSIHGNSTAPSASQDIISDIDLPPSIETFNDYRKVLKNFFYLVGYMPQSDNISDMKQHKQILAQDAYWAYKYEDDISSSIKSDLLNMKRTLSNNNFTHESADVENAVEEILAKSMEALGLFAKYTNNITKYHELTKSVKCQNCQSIEDVDSDFCGECGNQLPLIWECPECGSSEDTLNKSFCTSCGSELDEFPEDQRKELEEIKNDCIDTWNEADSILGDDVNKIVEEKIPSSLAKG
jgi:rubredoxin